MRSRHRRSSGHARRAAGCTLGFALLLVGAGAGAGPWSESLGEARRVEALRDPSAAVRAAAGWWLARAPLPPRSSGATARDPRIELPLVVLHERDPAAALAEVAALSHWTRGTREHAHRLLEVANAVLVPEIARHAALRAWSRDLEEDRLDDLILRAAPIGAPSIASDLAALGLAALPDPLLSAALQRTAAAPARRAGVIRALGFRGDPRWVEVIVTALRAPREPSLEPVLVQAIEAVSALRLTEAAPELVAIAEDPRVRGPRALAVRALGTLGGGFDTAVLARCAELPLTRLAALEAARVLGDPRLAPVCRRYLEAELPADRAAAVRCLGALGESQDLRARRSRETDPEVMAMLQVERESLAAQDDPRTDGELIAALAGAATEPPRVVAACALGARARRGEHLAREALAALVARERDLPSRAALAALRALVEAGGGLDDETLGTLLRSSEALVRRAAAHAIGAQGGPAAAATLRTLAVSETDDETRGTMAVALARALGDAALPVLEAMDETAFSPRQVAMLAHARRLAPAGPGRRHPLVTAIPLQDREIDAQGIWLATLADGGVVLGVGAMTGGVLIPEGSGAVLSPRQTIVR